MRCRTTYLRCLRRLLFIRFDQQLAHVVGHVDARILARTSAVVRLHERHVIEREIVLHENAICNNSCARRHQPFNVVRWRVELQLWQRVEQRTRCNRRHGNVDKSFLCQRCKVALIPHIITKIIRWCTCKKVKARRRYMIFGQLTRILVPHDGETLIALVAGTRVFGSGDQRQPLVNVDGLLC